jgi:hypothetical protein
VPLLVLETQVAAIPRMKQFTKPQDHYTDITLEGNVTIAFAESRSVLEGIGIGGEILATPGHSDDSVSFAGRRLGLHRDLTLLGDDEGAPSSRAGGCCETRGPRWSIRRTGRCDRCMARLSCKDGRSLDILDHLRRFAVSLRGRKPDTCTSTNRRCSAGEQSPRYRASQRCGRLLTCTCVRCKCRRAHALLATT